MTETGKIIVEGGGGAALAAIIQQPRQFAKKTGLAASGANIDARLLASI